jgi:hypothetical protein
VRICNRFQSPECGRSRGRSGARSAQRDQPFHCARAEDDEPRNCGFARDFIAT